MPYRFLASVVQMAHGDLEEFGRTLRQDPRYLDRICDAIRNVLQRASRPLDAVCEEEHGLDEMGVQMIYHLEAIFLETKDANGSFHKLFQKNITTRDNLAALCKLCDHTIDVGEEQCVAMPILHMLCEDRIVWRIKMRDGTLFALTLFRSLGKLLDPGKQVLHNNDAPDSCLCVVLSWRTLKRALWCWEGDRTDLVATLSMQDWTAIFEFRYGSEEDDLKDFPTKLECYHIILGAAYRILRADESNTAAMKILRDLGACEKLCRRALSWFPNIASHQSAWGRSECFCFNTLVAFLSDYFGILPTISGDRGFEKLVQSARRVILNIKDDIPTCS